MQTRQTIQKQTILEYLQSVKTHPSADKVYSEVKKKIPTISFATVYRNLNQLAERGKIREVCFDKECARYDAHTGDHQHFVCVSCGRVKDHFGKYPALRKGLSRDGKYKILDVDITVRGLCQKCKAKK